VSQLGKVAGHAFISYVREDSRRADQLQRILEAAGIPVWRDTADLWPGQDWRANIRRAITNDALVFLACFSQLSLSRSRSYQNEELLLAIEQLRLRPPDDPWLIPVRFDESDIPDRDLGGGRTLASIQRADLFGDKFGEGAARLVAAVLRILGRDSGTTAIMGEPARSRRVTDPDMLRSSRALFQGQVIDRYTKAIEQLGSEMLDVRIGGIYALERVAQVSAKDHPAVMETLAAFIREHSHDQWPPPGDVGREQERRTRSDVQAALTVLGRRDTKRDTRSVDLTGADLTGAHLRSAQLTGMDLTGTDLRDADLRHADLTGTSLVNADLRYADLRYAKLAGAFFLRRDPPQENRLFFRDWDPVIRRLQGAQLDGASWPEHAGIPVGWKLDTSGGRLEWRADDPRRPRFPFQDDDR